MKVNKTGSIPDLFGNTRHVYQTVFFEAWILETTDDTYFISVFDIVTSLAQYHEEIELSSFNLAYITMYDNLWKLEKERLPY